jgi:predicted transcriptional regulator
MPRAATTSDVFNAIAEPRRRQIIDLLARRGALAVVALVVAVGIPQPAVAMRERR